MIFYTGLKEFNAIYKRNYEDAEDYNDLLCKNLENIGVSAGEISEKNRSLFLYSKDDWKAIIGFRNISAHTYKVVSMKIVLDIIKNDIPKLKDKTANIILSLIQETLENKKPIEFEFDKKVYSLNYLYPYNDKITVTVDNNNFNPITLPKKNISQAVDNIINDKELMSGISIKGPSLN